MKKDKKTVFSQEYSARKQKKEITNASLTLIVGGLLLTGISLIRMVVSVGFSETLSLAAAVLGLILTVLGTVAPQAAAPVLQKLSGLFNRFGVLLIRVLLVPVYFLTFVTTCWFVKNKKKAYRFEAWKERPPVPASFFEEGGATRVRSSKRYAVLSSLFSEIAAHKMYFLIPLVVVLLIVGLIFFFISSSTVFSFVYTFLSV